MYLISHEWNHAEATSSSTGKLNFFNQSWNVKILKKHILKGCQRILCIKIYR